MLKLENEIKRGAVSCNLSKAKSNLGKLKGAKEIKLEGRIE